LLVRLSRLAAGGGRPRARDRRSRGRGNRDKPVPSLDPPPAVHARTLRFPRGHAAEVGGSEPSSARAPVPLRDRARGAGTRGRRAARRDGLGPVLAIIGSWLRARRGWSSWASASTPAPTASTRSSRSPTTRAEVGGAPVSG